MSQPQKFTIADPSGRVQCSKGWHRDKTVNDKLVDLECWYVFKGTGEMIIDGKSFSLKPGYFILMQPGHEYLATQNDQDPLGVNYLHFDGDREWIKKRFTSPIYLSDIEFTDSTLSHIQSLWHGNKFQVAQQWLFSLLCEMASQEDINYQKSNPSKIQECVKWIHTNSTLPKVNECAKFCFWSPAHFSREFTKLIGKTPIEFLLNEKINRAKYLLRETNYSIQQISTQLEYSDVYFFSRQFKNITGKSPSEFRKT